MPANTVKSRTVSIRTGTSIIKEVESARNLYQQTKAVSIPRENITIVGSDYRRTADLIERLNSVNEALSTQK